MFAAAKETWLSMLMMRGKKVGASTGPVTRRVRPAQSEGGAEGEREEGGTSWQVGLSVHVSTMQTKEEGQHLGRTGWERVGRGRRRRRGR